jgi:hypothetical protein
MQQVRNNLYEQHSFFCLLSFNFVVFFESLVRIQLCCYSLQCSSEEKRNLGKPQFSLWIIIVSILCYLFQETTISWRSWNLSTISNRKVRYNEQLVIFFSIHCCCWRDFVVGLCRLKIPLQGNQQNATRLYQKMFKNQQLELLTKYILLTKLTFNILNVNVNVCVCVWLSLFSCCRQPESANSKVIQDEVVYVRVPDKSNNRQYKILLSSNSHYFCHFDFWFV